RTSPPPLVALPALTRSDAQAPARPLPISERASTSVLVRRHARRPTPLVPSSIDSTGTHVLYSLLRRELVSAGLYGSLPRRSAPYPGRSHSERSAHMSEREGSVSHHQTTPRTADPTANPLAHADALGPHEPYADALPLAAHRDADSSDAALALRFPGT